MKRRTLAEAYASIPEVACAGRCWKSCGPIPMAPLEVERVRAAALTPFEMTSSARVGGGLVMVADDGSCPQLDAMRRCSVYDARPMICRLFGVAAGLRCPFGCEPARELSNDEARDLLAAALEARR